MRTVKVYDKAGNELAPMSHYKAMSMLLSGKAKIEKIIIDKTVKKEDNNFSQENESK